MSSRRSLLGLIAFGLLVAVITALGIGVRATYGAQVTADEPQYLLSALSLWEDRSLDISDELADERYREFHEAALPRQTRLLDDGSQISPHDPLLPLLLAGPTGAWGWVGAKATLAALAGVLASLTVWAARNRLGVSSRTAYIIAGLFALAPPFAMYSTQVYPELAAALALLAGFAAILGPLDFRGRVLFVLAVVSLPWLAVKYIPLAAVLAVAGLVRAGRGRRTALAIWLAAAGVVFVLGHLAIYGGLTPYATGDHFVAGELTAVGADADLWGRSSRLIGLLVDRGFGIGAWQPAYLILPLVTAWAVAKRRDGYIIAASLLAVGWLVATFVALTMHGWWFPGRQLIVVLPVAVLLISAWADEARWRLRTISLVGAVGVVAFAYLLAEGLSGRLTWVVDFGATANPIYRATSTLFPDYMTPTSSTWILHAIWVAAALALIWVGWRGASRSPGTSETTGFDRKGNQERVLT